MSSTPKRIPAKQAEVWVAPLSRWLGSREAVSDFRRRKDARPEDAPNTLLLGEPGTGTTSLLTAHARDLLGAPQLGHGEDAGIWRRTPGPYDFLRIDGGSVPPAHLENLVEAAKDPAGADHTVVVVSKLGELFARGLEGRLYGMLDSPRVTTLAAGIGFSRGSGVQHDEYLDRVRSLLGHFPVRFRTQNPSERELLAFLAELIFDWGMRVDDEKTLHLLVRKSGCVVGRAKNALVHALATNGGLLSYEVVCRYDADPSLVC